MTRFFLYVALLLPICLVATLAMSLLLFRQLDLTFTAFAGVVLAPLFQAATLALAETPLSGARAAAHRVWQTPLARPVLFFDAAVLGAGLIAWPAYLVGFGAAVTIQPAWAAAKAALAAVFLFSRARDRSCRLQFVGLAVLALALAGSIFVAWPAAAWPMMATTAAIPGIAARIATDGSLVIALIALALACARCVQTASPSAALLFRGAAAAVIALGAIDALAAFNHRTLPQPWFGRVIVAASVAASFTCLAVLVESE